MSVEPRGVSWLIVGGGVHGVHVAAQLVGRGGIAGEQLRILDPGQRLLESWRCFTSTTGMTHLRSPGVHHLDPDPWSLYRFAGKKRRRKRGSFAPPYDRPSLALFNAHCAGVIAKHNLESTHVSGWASACRVESDGLSVFTRDGRVLRAENLVLALGASEQPEWPSWAPIDDSRVRHIFARGFDRNSPSPSQPIAVVGGGISAAQVALRLYKEGRKVHLISRHAVRQHQFDSRPGWLGPKFMDQFSRERSLRRRRAIIVAARHRGSLPPDVSCELRQAINSGGLTWHECEVEGVAPTKEHLLVRLTEGGAVRVRRILLATGFSPRRPGGRFLDDLIEAASLLCAPCGYPIVDYGLRWHPRIRVTGPLAELELGPTSRNIAGARRAGERVVQSLEADGNALADKMGGKGQHSTLRLPTAPLAGGAFTCREEAIA